MNREAIAEIRNKLQAALTTIEALNSGKEVPKDFVKKALDELQEAVKLLKDSFEG